MRSRQVVITLQLRRNINTLQCGILDNYCVRISCVQLGPDMVQEVYG